MKIIILDGHTVNPGDLSWDFLDEFGTWTAYDATEPGDILSRIGDAEILITSKCHITAEIMADCPNLKYIGVIATGYNNIDLAAARKHRIAVTNIPAYSTDAVAQHTIALMLELTNRVGLHDRSVKQGEWTKCDYFCYWKKPIGLLSGKSLGIIGYGQIGKKVAEIAHAFGMTINIYSQNQEAAVKSDFVSLHCPLTPENAKFVDTEFIIRMKPGAFLINTARGGLVDEEALATSLKNGFLRGAAVDVLSTEPPSADNPLLQLENCIITPHMAWAPEEMRRLICDITAQNLRSFFNGETMNRVEDL